MLKVSASDFKKNIDKYLTAMMKEEVIITQSGVSIAKIVPAEKESNVEKLKGIIPDDGFTVEKAKNQRLTDR